MEHKEMNFGEADKICHDFGITCANFDVFRNARVILSWKNAHADLLSALKMALSAHGRTVEQAIDEVPLEGWEVAARAAIAKAGGDAHV